MLLETNTASYPNILKLIVTNELMLINNLLNTILKQNRMVFLFSNYE